MLSSWRQVGSNLDSTLVSFVRADSLRGAVAQLAKGCLPQAADLGAQRTKGIFGSPESLPSKLRTMIVAFLHALELCACGKGAMHELYT